MNHVKSKAISRCLVAAIVLIFAFTSCAHITSNYYPKDSRFVTSSYTDGGFAYHRDGTTYRAGYHNKGLVDAVSPNPAAKEYAENGVDKSKLALGLQLAGLGVYLAGAILTAVGTDKKNNLMEWGGIGTMFGGLGIVLGSVKPQKQSKVLFQDAINKYNDDVINEKPIIKEGE
ncbi:MAG: hypothetical protein ABIE74_00335 [Pseudomonadota bacterium]